MVRTTPVQVSGFERRDVVGLGSETVVFQESQRVLSDSASLASASARLDGDELTHAIPSVAAILDGEFYAHDRATATTCPHDSTTFFVRHKFLTTGESRLIDFGRSQKVINSRVAFQADTQAELAVVVEPLTGRRVVAFLRANQTTGYACEVSMFVPSSNLRDRPRAMR